MDIEARLTYKKDPDDERDFLFQKSVGEDKQFKQVISSIPSAVDHTFSMTPVKDQGNLGSCVGFAI